MTTKEINAGGIKMNFGKHIRQYFVAKGINASLVVDSPYFYIALTMMILGTFLFVAGFLGEMISRNSNTRNLYKIDKKI